jgi:hypothetical protein
MADLLRRHWQALFFEIEPDSRLTELRYLLPLLSLHLLGLLTIVRLTHQPLWLLLPAGLLLLRWKKFYFLPESLAPMGLAYGVLLARLGVALVARLMGLSGVPEPFGTWLDLNLFTAISGCWALLLQTQAGGAFSPGQLIALLTVLWADVTYLTLRARGVTAVDPYGYVQMAIDIVEHGTPAHTFPLARRVAEWGLPLYPTVPLGYTFPDPLTGQTGTPWPPGHSVLLALGYWLGGEPGVYLVTPLLGLLALGMIWFMVLEVVQGWSDPRQRFLVAGLAVFILATSYQQIERLSVAMSDASSQLFTMLTIYFALRGLRARTVWPATLAGVCLGVAFAMRYTQVLVAFSALFLIIIAWRRLPLSLAGFSAGAWLLALPVLWYHQQIFGGPFTTGSYELGHFSLAHIPLIVRRMVSGVLADNEFLFLAPWILWGAGRLWFVSWRSSVALWLLLSITVLFYLPYHLFNLRHLLPIFPILALWAGLGVADMLGRLQRWGGACVPYTHVKIGPVAGVTLAVLLFWGRTHQTLILAVSPDQFGTYGYLTAEERAAFDTIGTITAPHQSIIAASTHGGAVNLYTGQTVVRPSDWSRREWLEFIELALADGAQIYLLLDGEVMEYPFEAARNRYQLFQVAILPMTYFFADGTGEKRSVKLYMVSDKETPIAHGRGIKNPNTD